ncbi:PLCXD2 [Symbiodinium sp. CCMP2456]|nr:PLCXD2 [Symbiodinium sp. CCMP2456]
MPGSEDHDDGDTAKGLLQNILERVSNGAETVGSAMHNARASYEESGRHFKGKIMSKLMTYGAGMRNDARAFFKNVEVPTEVQTTIYEGYEGDRKVVQTSIPVIDVHELLDFLQTEVQLVCPMDQDDLDCMVPFSIYGDELTLAKDSRDKDSCTIHENLQTLAPILEHIVWSCNQAGQKFSGGTRWVCAELKGDWKWHERTLTAFSNWFSSSEKAKRFLTPAQSQDIYDNGMLFLKCHLQLTRVSHRLQIFAWILKPKYHAMLHLLEQSHKWHYNSRYTHCFAGEDAMGWLKRA